MFCAMLGEDHCFSVEPQPNGGVISRKQVVVVGEAAIDVLVACGAEGPVWGQVETLVDDARLVLGSSGAITAAALAALDVPVAFVGIAGDDHLGEFFVHELERLGVIAAVQRSKARPTGLTVAIERDGDRAMLTYSGTMADLATGGVPGSLLASAAHLHISSYFLQRGLHPGLPALLDAARRVGTTTSLDPGWDVTGTWNSGIGSVLPHLDWLLANEAEAKAIATQLAGGSTPDDVIGTLLAALGGGGLALKRAGAGAALASGEDFLTLDTEPLLPVDTTGAGDNFNAGLIAGLLGGLEPAELLALAVACGRHAVGGRGGTGRLPTRAEAEAAAGPLAAAVRMAPLAAEPTLRSGGGR